MENTNDIQTAEARADSLQRAGSALVELADSIERLLEIVEGCRGERWQSNGRRLVDTPEWCAFYVAHQSCKHEAPNDELKNAGH